VQADPGAPGRYAVDTAEYDLGDLAVELPGLGGRAELRGKVYAPRGAVGKRPLVVFLHGFHEICTGELQVWPCPVGQKAVPSYRGYGAPAEALASHGYQVISISANAVNAGGGKTVDRGATARGELVLAHLDLWRRWSTMGDGPFGKRFVGRVDLSNVGLLGHSRGGDGVVDAALANAFRPAPYGIRAVMPLASTDGGRATIPGVAMSLLMGYCDGDVSDLQGQHYYDDTRYAVNDQAPRSTVLVMGANHNFWNSEWSPGQSETPSIDDWGFNPDNPPCGTATPTRLSATEQQAIGRAYIAGFFRLMLGNETAFAPLFDGSGRRPASAASAEIHVVAQAPAQTRSDVFRFDRPLPAGAVAGGVTATTCSGVPPFEAAKHALPYCVNNPRSDLFPHWVTGFLVPEVPNPAITAVRWNDRTGVVRLQVPSRDVSRYDALSFRAAPDPASAGPQDLTVRVLDVHGRFQDVAVSSVSDALHPLPGQPEDGQPKTMLRTVRIPMAMLRSLDVDDIRAVELRTDRIAQGAIFVSDLAFSRWSRGTTTLPALPSLSVSDTPTVREGDSGTRTADFVVTLSRPSRSRVTVHAETSGFFFDPEIVSPLAEELTFEPGQTRKTISVEIHGNTTPQSDQPFNVALTTPQNAALNDAWGTGLALDDDGGAALAPQVARRQNYDDRVLGTHPIRPWDQLGA
jgi:hypothetical protein